MIPILFYAFICGLTVFFVLYDKDNSTRRGFVHFFISFLFGWMFLPIGVYDTVIKIREEIARLREKEGRFDINFGDTFDL